MADEMRIAAEDLSWFLKPSTIPKHYFMYMFLPVVNEAQLVASNKTYTDEYKQLQVKVHQLMPSTLPMDACYAAVFFLFLFALLRVGISFFLPTYFNSLDKSKKNEIGPYLASLVHHGFVVFLGFRCILLDFIHILSKGTADIQVPAVKYLYELGIAVPVAFGFLIAETLFLAIPEVISKGKVDIFFHHILGFGLIYFFVQSPLKIAPYMPHFLCTEFSAVFFNLAWFLRTTSFKDSVMVKVFEYSFVVTFFLLRCFNLPVATMGVLMLVGKENWMAKYLLIPIQLLQFYWMHLIVTSTIKRIYEKHDDADGTNSKNKKGIDNNDDDININKEKSLEAKKKE